MPFIDNLEDNLNVVNERHPNRDAIRQKNRELIDLAERDLYNPEFFGICPKCFFENGELTPLEFLDVTNAVVRVCHKHKICDVFQYEYGCRTEDDYEANEQLIKDYVDFDDNILPNVIYSE